MPVPVRLFNKLLERHFNPNRIFRERITVGGGSLICSEPSAPKRQVQSLQLLQSLQSLQFLQSLQSLQLLQSLQDFPVASVSVLW